MTLSRREFIRTAGAIGAAWAWGGCAGVLAPPWREHRDLYPEGVARAIPTTTASSSGRAGPFDQGGEGDQGERHVLTLELAEDEAFRRVVAHAPAPVSAASDWTTRVLVGGLEPARTYWYRFTDADGNGSRVGRTRTAPRADDPRPVQFAFVSCQSVNEGALNGYRRMIFEDERAGPADQLDFVLHLGDFIYEVVQYPDEVPTRYDRTIYEVARIPDGLKVGNFHVP
jgi:alkaline phosphatase D